MKRIIFLLLLTLHFIFPAIGQSLLEICHKSIQNQKINYLLNNKSTSEQSRFDIQQTTLSIQVNPDTLFIEGAVSHKFIVLDSLNGIVLDLTDNMLVDSIVYHNSKINFQHINNQILIDFSNVLTPNSIDSILIHYRGAPISNGLGSFVQSSPNGVDSMIWTLSQPFGAANWWPCKNSLSDKIEKAQINIEVPLGYQVASNGLLSRVDTNGLWHTFHWESNYPIATYLLAIAVAKYEVFEEKIALRNDSLLFQHFLYPGDNISLNQSKNISPAFMQLFDSLFGAYPFINEKYGHASFTFPGGMEHQTMSFMGSYGGELIAHELAHQWFGNKVTCSSWKDLWLNEAFATYATMLTYEFNVKHDRAYLPQVLYSFKNYSTSFPNSSVYVYDTSSASSIFTGLPYYKGASVLHLLRYNIGEQAFFQGIRNYLNDSNLIYGFSNTKKLQSHFEASSNKDLEGFFKDWIYGKGYPNYNFTWTQSGSTFQLKVNQIPSDPSVYFFETKIPIKLFANNWDSTLIFNPLYSGQTFYIPVNQSIDSIQFDPEHWIPAKAEITVGIEENSSPSSSLSVFPNPANDYFFISSKEELIKSLTISNLAGQIIASFGPREKYDISSFPAGIYLLQIENTKGDIIQKMLKITK